MNPRVYKEYEYEKAKQDTRETGEPLWDTLQPANKDAMEVFQTQITARPIQQGGIARGPRGIVGWKAQIRVTPNRLLVNLLPEEHRATFYEMSDLCQTEDEAVSQARARLEARIAPIRQKVEEALTGYTYAYAVYPDVDKDLVTPMEKSGVEEFIVTQLYNEQIIEVLVKKGVSFIFFAGIELAPEPTREQYREKIDKCCYPL